MDGLVLSYDDTYASQFAYIACVKHVVVSASSLLL